MASPFQVFRKNQKVLMAFLVGTSMLAFIVADSINATNFPIFIGALLGAVALWLLSGKGGTEGWMIAAVGAVLGAVVGVYGPTFFRDNAVVHTAEGNLSAQDIERINRRQNVANDFLRLAAQTIGERVEKANEGKPDAQKQRPPSPQLFGFVPATTSAAYRENAVMTYLFEKEADDLGINLSDDSVVEYLNEAFDGRLTQDDLKRIRAQMQVGTGDLVDILREQLRTRQAFRLLAPPPNGPQPDHPLMALLQKTWPPTPQQLWSEFKKVNASAEVTAVAVPADAFVAEVPDPSATELAAYFDQYKTRLPGGDGAPGFMVPRQFQVAYLEIDADQLKNAVAPPTDAEVRAVYERTRSQFPNAPGGLGGTPAAPGGKAPAEAPKPKPAEAPEAPAAETATPPATPEQPKNDTPATDTPAAPEKPPGESSSALDSGGLEFVAFQDEQPKADPAPPAEAPKAEAPKPDAATSDAPKEDAAKPDTPKGDAPKGDAPKEDTPKADAPKTDSPPLTPPAFPPLPGDAKPGDAGKTAEPSAAMLKEIREDIINQRVRALADERLKKAREDVYQIINDVFDRIPIPEDLHDEQARRKYEQDRRAAAAEVGKRMEAYGKSHAKDGFKFFYTPLLSAQELFDSEDYPVGKATLWEENRPFANPNAPSVAAQLEMSSQDQPIAPIPAQSGFNEDRFLAVKVADIEPKVPTLDDKAVKDRVVKAWKLFKARDLAKERAEALAKADAKDKDLAEAVKAQTVTGKAGAPELTARQVGPFSWLRKSTAPSTMMSLPALVPTDLPQLPGAGEKFMETVFRSLKPGETAVAPSEDGSTYYVVELDSRTGEQDVAKLRDEFLGEKDEFFGFGPYRMRQFQQAQQTQGEWFRAFRLRHGVTEGAAPEEEPAA